MLGLDAKAYESFCKVRCAPDPRRFHCVFADWNQQRNGKFASISEEGSLKFQPMSHARSLSFSVPPRCKPKSSDRLLVTSVFCPARYTFCLKSLCQLNVDTHFNVSFLAAAFQKPFLFFATEISRNKITPFSTFVFVTWLASNSCGFFCVFELDRKVRASVATKHKGLLQFCALHMHRLIGLE